MDEVEVIFVEGMNKILDFVFLDVGFEIFVIFGVFVVGLDKYMFFVGWEGKGVDVCYYVVYYFFWFEEVDDVGVFVFEFVVLVYFGIVEVEIVVVFSVGDVEVIFVS